MLCIFLNFRNIFLQISYKTNESSSKSQEFSYQSITFVLIYKSFKNF